MDIVRMAFLPLTILCGACTAPADMPGIRFDLTRLNPEGLQGPADGLRALHYEFCIPDQIEVITAVTAIDPTLDLIRSSPGRIGCGKDQILCLGHTHQPNYRQVLEQLDRHPQVGEIQEAVFE